MQGKKQNNMMIKRTVDACMTVLLLCLMAYQVTGEVLHEWIGIGMTVLVIVHQILNRRWYGAIFKGKYNAYRILTTVLNVLLLLSFALTAFCGMSMSGHAVPFLYGMTKISFARRMHLSMSHWAFVLMGLHLGLHVPMMAARLKLTDGVKMAVSVVMCGLAGIGLYLFLKSGMSDYLFFRVPFAFLDYEKAAAAVFLENILMLLFWAFIGTQAAGLCRGASRKGEEKSRLIHLVFIMAAIIVGLVIRMAVPADDAQGFGSAGWSGSQDAEVADSGSDLQEEEAEVVDSTSNSQEAEEAEDDSQEAEEPDAVSKEQAP